MKSLGQIAHEAGAKQEGQASRWHEMHPEEQANWEAIAAAVVQASLERDSANIKALERELIDLCREFRAVQGDFVDSATKPQSEPGL